MVQTRCRLLLPPTVHSPAVTGARGDMSGHWRSALGYAGLNARPAASCRGVQLPFADLHTPARSPPELP